ncbi:MAG: response regulator [Candidatus Omnitrophica bacterium]|nr:response regulator [Candidatus Omnitrophota bacterium]
MPGKKILVVDDETELVAMVKMRLEANRYEVITAADGQEGLDAARRERPDLILLDLMLPKIDGYKVCGLLKADTRFRAIPVIVFTARAQDSDKKMAEETGADAYLTKPFEPQALLKKIAEFIG